MPKNIRPLGPLVFAKKKIILGDPGRSHVCVTKNGVEARTATVSDAFIAWTEVNSLSLEVPQTPLKLPPIAWKLFSAVITLMSSQTPEFAPDEDGCLFVATRKADTRYRLSPFHPGKYWARDAAHVQAFLNLLVADPSRRKLIDHSGAHLRRLISRMPASQ